MQLDQQIPRIIEQLSEEPSNEPELRWWVNFTISRDPLIRWKGHDVYIALYPTARAAKRGLDRVEAVKRHLFSEDPVELPLPIIKTLYEPSNRPVYQGVAFCDSTGAVVEWRRW